MVFVNPVAINSKIGIRVENITQLRDRIVNMFLHLHLILELIYMKENPGILSLVSN